MLGLRWDTATSRGSSAVLFHCLFCILHLIQLLGRLVLFYCSFGMQLLRKLVLFY